MCVMQHVSKCQLCSAAGHSNGILVRNRAQSIPKHGACRAMGSTWTPVLDVPLVIHGGQAKLSPLPWLA